MGAARPPEHSSAPPRTAIASAASMRISFPSTIRAAGRCIRSYCAASLAIARSFAAVSSLSEAGCGMAMTL
jgi:hypothetical protein